MAEAGARNNIMDKVETEPDSELKINNFRSATLVIKLAYFTFLLQWSGVQGHKTEQIYIYIYIYVRVQDRLVYFSITIWRFFT